MFAYFPPILLIPAQILINFNPVFMEICWDSFLIYYTHNHVVVPEIYIQRTYDQMPDAAS